MLLICGELFGLNFFIARTNQRSQQKRFVDIYIYIYIYFNSLLVSPLYPRRRCLNFSDCFMQNLKNR